MSDATIEREVDIEAGMAPIRAYSHAETRVIANALAAVQQRELRDRLDPARMMELEIYPEIWDRAEARDQLLLSVDHPREVVSTVAGRGFGLLVFITWPWPPAAAYVPQLCGDCSQPGGWRLRDRPG